MTTTSPPIKADDPRNPEAAQLAGDWLRESNAQLTELLRTQLADRQALREITRLLDDRTAGLRLDVNQDCLDTGKPRYGNDTARGDALKLALAADPQAVGIRVANDKLQDKIDAGILQIDEWHRRRGDRLALIRHNSSWLAYQAAYANEG